MKEDIYNKIIELCENAIKSIPNSKNHIELAASMNGALCMIIGVCGGAKVMEKYSE